MSTEYMSATWLREQTGPRTWTPDEQRRLRKLYDVAPRIARQIERGEVAREYLRYFPLDPRD